MGFFALGTNLAISFLNTNSVEMENSVLRITKVDDNSSRVTLKLEGKIASEWVPLLERECLKYQKEKRKVLLDFSDVTFVDENGVKILRRLAAAGVRFNDRSGLVKDLFK